MSENKKFRIYHQPGRYVEPISKIIESSSHFHAAYDYFKTIWKLEDKEFIKQGYKLVVVRMSGLECQNGTFSLLQTYKDSFMNFEIKDSILVESAEANHSLTSELVTHDLQKENKK